MIDISGKEFNGITVTSFLHTKKGVAYWNCVCHCGKKMKAYSAALRYGRIKSCGCKRWTHKENSKLEEKTFGRWTVVSFSSSKWKCECTCGTVRDVDTNSLTSGKSKSCGCLAKEINSSRLRVKLSDNESKKRRKESRRKYFVKNMNDPVFAESYRLRQRINILLKKGDFSCRSATMTMLGYTKKDLKEHIEKQFYGNMNWDNRNDWHIDHIVPISSATNLEDVIALNQLSNLRPLWAKDNLKKGSSRDMLL